MGRGGVFGVLALESEPVDRVCNLYSTKTTQFRDAFMRIAARTALVSPAAAEPPMSMSASAITKPRRRQYFDGSRRAISHSGGNGRAFGRARARANRFGAAG